MLNGTTTTPAGASGLVATMAPEDASPTGGVAGSLKLDGVNAFYGTFRAIRDISLAIRPRAVTAFIGPSGCGKSTLLRTINRMHETIRGARVDGRIAVDGVDIYQPGIPVTRVRQMVGMVFQRPNPFPSMSIFDNVASGVRLAGVGRRGDLEAVVEQSLQRSALWDEVKDKLRAPGTSLSGGQQQRLCIARAIATQPEILLLDEPCSALDPVSTQRIEELLRALREQFTIVIVTHNLQQAGRVSDETAFFTMGEDRAGYLVEFGGTERLFTSPAQRLTEDYIEGRFG
jgi:phosphate transport system ATP-binding protein